MRPMVMVVILQPLGWASAAPVLTWAGYPVYPGQTLLVQGSSLPHEHNETVRIVALSTGLD
eukprot:gene7490-3092_t